MHQVTPTFNLFNLKRQIPQKVQIGLVDTRYLQSAIAALAEDFERIQRLFSFEGRAMMNDGGLECIKVFLCKRGIFKMYLLDDRIGVIPSEMGKRKAKITTNILNRWFRIFILSSSFESIWYKPCLLYYIFGESLCRALPWFSGI